MVHQLGDFIKEEDPTKTLDNPQNKSGATLKDVNWAKANSDHGEVSKQSSDSLETMGSVIPRVPTRSRIKG